MSAAGLSCNRAAQEAEAARSATAHCAMSETGFACNRATQEPAAEPGAPVNVESTAPDNEPPGEPGEVTLHQEGGSFVVPVSINDRLTLDFVVDSGASYVSIPADVVLTLIRTGTIHREDFLGKQNFQLADGSTVPSQIFIIRQLRLGNHELRNVRASTAPTSATLLLGQSFLGRFKSWSIDNRRHKLILD